MGLGDLRIRSEAPGDAAAIRVVKQRAFGGIEEARLVAAIRQSPGFLPALSLVAEREGQLVGHILFSEVAIHQEDGGHIAKVDP